MARKRRRSIIPEIREVTIESMSHEGRGIAHVSGKTQFVFGALEHERVRIQVEASNRKFDQARTVEVIEASPRRIEPKCAAFQVCGGCSLQHLDNGDQVEFKQRMLVETMDHAGVRIGEIIPPLRSAAWGYRRKARLGVKYVRKKGRVLVGFRERQASFLADMHRCEVLIPVIGEKLDDLSVLIEDLSVREHVPQIEMASDGVHTALVFRHLRALSAEDRDKLVTFGEEHDLWIQLQSAGPDSIVNLYPQSQSLYFEPTEDGDIRIAFSALDFIQVNDQINQKMVAQALHYLDLKPHDRVLDLFCGLGNFTLPMARLCSGVTGVEGDASMVERARRSARENGVDNTQYHLCDLFQPDASSAWMNRRFDKILLDPPRIGAQEMVRLIERFEASTIVYVSCQPSSLVRDAAIICSNGYRLTQLGVMDMFPQTAHVESMAVFQRH